MDLNSANNKKQFVFMKIIIVISLVLLFSFGVNAIEKVDIYENVIDVFENSEVIDDSGPTEEISIDSSEELDEVIEEQINNSEETSELCSQVDCGVSEIICQDNFSASCQNVCDSESGDCDSCIPDCSEHEIEFEINKTNQIDDFKNTTETNQTNEQEDLSNLVSELELEIFYPDSFVRGNILKVRATVLNNGANVTEAVLNWTFPENFKVVLGDSIKKCGDLNTGEFCESVIDLEVPDFASLGKDEIKVKVIYEDGI